MRAIESGVIEGVVVDKACVKCATTVGVEFVEDPYEADVENTPGVMICICPDCLQELLWSV